MIKHVYINNYKSVQDLELELGRITVLIGENGSGKTNILEAIALASAAYQDKLDNEFLVPRGIRVTEPQFMRSAFDLNYYSKKKQEDHWYISSIQIYLQNTNKIKYRTSLLFDWEKPFSKWSHRPTIGYNNKDMIEYSLEQKQIQKITEAGETYYGLPPGFETQYLYQSLTYCPL